MTGTSSSAKCPASWAAPARCWERTLNSSCSAREMPYSRRRFSAVFQHPAGDGVVLAAGGLAGAHQPVHQLDVAATDAGTQALRVVLDVRHRLGATGHHDARRAGCDLAGGVQDRLEAAAAAPVDLQARHAGAEACASSAAMRPMAGFSPLG